MDCCSCGPHWKFTADLLWLGRTHADPQTLLVADIGGLQIGLLDASDLQFEISAGVRSQMIVQRPAGWGYELGYLGVFDQHSHRSVSIDPTTPNLNSVTDRFFGTAGGTATAYTVDYQSDLNSAELNLRLGEWWGFVPVVGGRWFRLDEQYEMFETPTPTTGVLSEVTNDLVGAQAGFHKPLWCRGGWFHVETTIKFGAFQNQTDLYADAHDAGGPLVSLERSFEGTSFAAEVHLTAIWQFSEHAAFRAGYTGLWLTDVALALDQSDDFDLVTGQGTLDRGTVAMHGGHLGFEVRW
jgi:hypothetical protein